VSARKLKRKYNNFEKAELDIKTSVNKIGEIINLAQELNTIIWNKINKGTEIDDIMDIYYDVAKLDVMSNIEIDKAKKEYNVDNIAEINKIKAKYQEVDKNSGKRIKPYFLGEIAKPKGYYNSVSKSYVQHKTTMDYLQKILNSYRNDKINRKYINFVDILDDSQFNKSYIKYDQVERVLTLIEDMRKEVSQIWSSDNFEQSEKYNLSSDVRQTCIEYIDTIKMSYSTMYYMLYLISTPEYQYISRTVFNVLFGTPNKSFFEVIKKSKEPLPILEEDDNGEMQIYDIKYRKTYKKS
jgi:hypothetical protein